METPWWDATTFASPERRTISECVAMPDIVPIAPIKVKCLLHHSAVYADEMKTPADRLKEARIKAGFISGSAVARLLGIPIASYNQHERGERNFTQARALRYAQIFRTTPEWLLYGRSGRSEPSIEELQQMLDNVFREVLTLGVKIEDLSAIAAPALHEQIMRWKADQPTPRG
jgi:transcriptional regulator with XRE-family HTH domain